ncbi:hypothetical protein C3B58_12590 [Lactonifactor longoviformis]|uniref:Uncharacterized protein n=1 Tax=Lactonifactor longoviformis DSM 17459 TaxID=1122155 RepID=A0A1M4ZQL6_9CLOT|nr:hypothetical protein [Lactonifactor longoviformis]POP32295.1 hypothetical protein C3B58_12590 [Lactonifactor longoviformis]SHF20097.1 hypothetical protein SAMN02745158_02856 [Lactonifactor longoviformis DSM 17459]
MFKKLGKKQLLGILTAAAIVVTTAGSFAVWDTLSDNTSGNLTLQKPITVSAEGGTAYSAGTRTLGVENTYEASDVTFNVANNNVENTQLKLDPKVTIGTGESATDVTNQFTIAIKKGDAVVTDNTDPNPEAINTYSVSLTPVEDASSDVINAANDGTVLNVQITGTLSVKSTPAS